MRGFNLIKPTDISFGPLAYREIRYAPLTYIKAPCLFLGRWLDRIFGTGIFFSAPLLMVGAACGFWSAWRWMHRQGLRQ